MTVAAPDDDPFISLVHDGTEEEVRAFLALLTPIDLIDALEALPEELRRRAFDSLEVDTQEQVVREAPDASVRKLLTILPDQEVGDLLEDVDEDLRVYAFDLLDIPQQATVLREVEEEDAREDLIEHLPDADLADIVELQLSDDATDLVEELDEERRARVLEEVEAARRAEIEELAAYPEESAGGLMQTELLRLEEGTTVAQAIEEVRRHYEELGQLADMYVIDTEGRLLGRVRGRHLLVNPAGRLIDEVMLTDVRPVPVDMDQEEIAELVQDYDLSSVPVVDADDRLVGRILVDDILDVVEEEATEDAALMGGTKPEDVHSRSVIQAVKSRLPWLVTVFVAGLVLAAMISFWEETLIQRFELLAAIIPLLMGMGGNVATQAATVTVRGIAINEIEFHDLGRVIVKEFAAGSIIAAFFGIVLYLYVLKVVPVVSETGWPEDVPRWVAAVVPSAAMIFTVAFAAAIGTLVPMVLDRLGKDPAIASAPFITTTVDILGIVILVGAVHVFLPVAGT